MATTITELLSDTLEKEIRTVLEPLEELKPRLYNKLDDVSFPLEGRLLEHIAVQLLKNKRVLILPRDLQKLMNDDEYAVLTD